MGDELVAIDPEIVILIRMGQKTRFSEEPLDVRSHSVIAPSILGDKETKWLANPADVEKVLRAHAVGHRYREFRRQRRHA